MKKHLSILYVDDEYINLELFSMCFKGIFYVEKAISGEDALKLLKEVSIYDIIISDMNMPEMDGLQFIKEALQVCGNIPCFILSGYNLNEEIKKAVNEGIVKEFIQKPFDKENLISLVEKWVQ
ncbi:MAG: response regulator [Leptospiraceae bacterium]|nr:response regulator [Leptospiraceae bacterium]MCP5499228.1 response regulator [Leptospiraceae bacterium]